MAFLCPARLRKEWKKRVQANTRPNDKPPAPGRITGSASMDTLVRVNMEKANGGRKAVMMVLYDFIPCIDEEIAVQKGDRVRILYKENDDWAYVIRDDGAEGFVPFTYLASPAKLSRRNALGDAGCDCKRCTDTPPQPMTDMTNKTSSLTLASTRAVQHSKNVSTDGSDVTCTTTGSRSTSDSESTRSNRIDHIRYRPCPDNVARLGGYVASTTNLHPARRVKPATPRIPVPEPGAGTSSGVYTDSDSPSRDSPSGGESPIARRRENIPCNKQNGSDSDSGCEQTTPRQQKPVMTTPSSDEKPVSTHVEAFQKTPLGKYLVMFNFEASQENDLSVRPGEFVTLLNKDDPDWYWVMTRDNEEGFVPSGYLCDVQGPGNMQQDIDSYNADESAMTDDSIPEPGYIMTSTPARPSMQRRPVPRKLLILRDYEARQPDDISVRKGQYVYADMDNQRFLDWIWVYSASQQKEGFIPRDFAKPPEGTIKSTEL